MINREPFIKKFKTDNNYYVYDINTNRIVLVNEVMYEIIPLLNKLHKKEIFDKLRAKFSEKSLVNNLDEIENMQSKFDLFSSSRPKIRGYSNLLSEHSLKAEYQKEGILLLILEATQQCNLRCKYCGFSGNYLFDRVHNSNHMDSVVMKKAIDFYMSKAKEGIKSISFYGGEPLLRFNLIKDAVRYLESEYPNGEKKIKISTNGTLLNEELIDFFIDNEITLQVSLDGPKTYHDMYRIDKKGRGTYDKLMKNLDIIYEKNPFYYQKHILFGCVVTPQTNLLELMNFFTSNHLVKNNFQRLTPVRKVDTDFFNNCESEISIQSEEWKFLQEKYLKDLSKEQIERFSLIQDAFEQMFIAIHKRYILNKSSEIVPIGGPCLPGARRLFVSVDGTFHICERINPNFPIGNVNGGYDFVKIAEILNKFRALANDSECLECWAMHLCNYCFSGVVKDGYMKISDKENFCHNKKITAINELKAYAKLSEENPKIEKKWDKVMIV